MNNKARTSAGNAQKAEVNDNAKKDNHRKHSSDKKNPVVKSSNDEKVHDNTKKDNHRKQSSDKKNPDKKNAVVKSSNDEKVKFDKSPTSNITLNHAPGKQQQQRRGTTEDNTEKHASIQNSRVLRMSSSNLVVDPHENESYKKVPFLEVNSLPRGGITIETEAVGRVQFGIPPETIKDSMQLGVAVPCVYIVPVERFCRDMGPALGVNLSEFEFPAYFNFFVQQRRCTLIVDGLDSERSIRRVFGETLLGPNQFRRENNPIAYEEEDFDPSFPRERIPNFAKELKHFRIMPDGNELVIETLLNFAHFNTVAEGERQQTLGGPPPFEDDESSGGHSITRVNKIDSIQRVETAFEKGQRRRSLQGISLEEIDAEGERDEDGDEEVENDNWAYDTVKYIGEVATVYQHDAKPEEIEARTCKRVEIFKMPGGTEYVLHDINEEGYIVGKARFAGIVTVPDSLSVVGFQADSNDDINPYDLEPEDDDIGAEVAANEATKSAGEKHVRWSDTTDSNSSPKRLSSTKKSPRRVLPPTFLPPSFGLTVLGNSHGFDKSGSTSGYVLWINGRGIMIDPPPFSSATLEMEGIRPRTIVGIILTHCHADHDAGAFQKVLTGTPVVVITTPTIYESFIRKYAALSEINHSLLRHCHRYKHAIIGQPLRFQGATFHFTYMLHSIPCVGFRVEWRGRSMVFTGDHMNIPEKIDALQEKGVLSEARAEELRCLPLQETDLLLHESGAPPIHTPLDVLLKLPERVKKRMYIVHTSALPEGCELRVAPTGTAQTIRLDEHLKAGGTMPSRTSILGNASNRSTSSPESSSFSGRVPSIVEDELLTDMGNEYANTNSSLSYLGSSGTNVHQQIPPLVALRPTSSSDAWFILNLLSAVPFLSSLSYSSTMEVLETARVDAFCVNDVVVPATRRREVLCVVWEGTCMEREQREDRQRAFQNKSRYRASSIVGKFQGTHGPMTFDDADLDDNLGAIWYAGDWTGPLSLQPDRIMSGENEFSRTHDIVAMSSEGVKVITVEFSNLHTILKSGSPLYRKYLDRKMHQSNPSPVLPGLEHTHGHAVNIKHYEAIRNLNIIELLECNSHLSRLSAIQKRHLESLAEGPFYYKPGERLWRAGAPVDKVFIVVSGTVSFVPKRRNAGSVSGPDPYNGTKTASWKASLCLDSQGDRALPDSLTLGDKMRTDAMRARQELGHDDDSSVSSMNSDSVSGKNLVPFDAGCRMDFRSSLGDSNDFAKLEIGLRNRAEEMHAEAPSEEVKKMQHENHKKSSEERLDNKVLGRLYNRRAFTAGLVFSRGHFLGDVSKMVSGLLTTEFKDEDGQDEEEPILYGGKGSQGTEQRDLMGDLTTHERRGDQFVVHASTLAAGKTGCSVLVFPKATFIPFLDNYPGLMLSLLGTQVVV